MVYEQTLLCKQSEYRWDLKLEGLLCAGVTPDFGETTLKRGKMPIG